jgi:hypothetical protein
MGRWRAGEGSGGGACVYSLQHVQGKRCRQQRGACQGSKAQREGENEGSQPSGAVDCMQQAAPGATGGTDGSKECLVWGTLRGCGSACRCGSCSGGGSCRGALGDGGVEHRYGAD